MHSLVHQLQQLIFNYASIDSHTVLQSDGTTSEVEQREAIFKDHDVEQNRTSIRILPLAYNE